MKIKSESMDFGRGIMRLMAMVLLTLVVEGKLAGGATGKNGKGLFKESCQGFKDCGTDTMLTCVNNVCQCASFQYYEASMDRCVSPVNGMCDVSQESKDGLPLLKCGELARCLRVRNERHGRCHCTTHNIKSPFDPKRCVPGPPPTEAPVHQPRFPGSSLEISPDPQHREDGQASLKQAPSFPGFAEPDVPKGGGNTKSDTSLVCSNLTLLLSASLFCLSRFVWSV